MAHELTHHYILQWRCTHGLRNGPEYEKHALLGHKVRRFRDRPVDVGGNSNPDRLSSFALSADWCSVLDTHESHGMLMLTMLTLLPLKKACVSDGVVAANAQTRGS